MAKADDKNIAKKLLKITTSTLGTGRGKFQKIDWQNQTYQVVDRKLRQTCN